MRAFRGFGFVGILFGWGFLTVDVAAGSKYPLEVIGMGAAWFCVGALISEWLRPRP